MEGLRLKKDTKRNTLWGGVSRLGTLFGVATMLVLGTGCPQTGGGGGGGGGPECTTAADCTARDCQTAACTDEACVFTEDCPADHCLGDPAACVACIGDGECDDSNACTDDACTDNACANTNNTADCDDSDACTEGDACADGTCAGTAMDCGDDDLCTNDVCTDGVCSNPETCAADETCDPADGTCSPAAADDLVDLAVDDTGADVDFDTLEVGDTITLTAPLPGGATRQVVTCDGCAWSVDPAAAGTFDPADDCVTDFTLDTEGGFTISVVVTCDDGSESTFNQAGMASPASVVICNVDIDCDDSSECTTESCVSNECVVEDVDCDDGLVCTDDTCDDAAGCANDDVVCDTGFACRESTGTGECEELTACTVAADCDDTVFCNGAETCVDSFCADGALPCTGDETCDEDLQDCVIGGITFNFTTDIDDLPGTGGDDIFRGVSATTNGTLSAGDAANGGAGNDQLKIFLTTADLGPGIGMDNIERVFGQNTSATPRSVSTLGWTGVEELWTDNSLGTVTFTGMDSLMVIGVLGTDQDITATFNNTALTGTNSVPVELDGAQNGASIIIGSTGSDGAETIALNSGGTVANRIDGIDDGGENDFTTLTITGDQDLRIDGPIGTSVKTVDASALTGAADVSVGGLTSFTFTGTAQDDTIRATNIGATDTIDGGGGSGDSLIVSGTFGTTTITGVANLTLQPTGVGAATPSFDLTNAQDITSVTIEPTVNITGLSGSGLPPSTAITVDSAFNVGLGGTASAFTLETPTGSADSLGFVFTGNANVTVTGGGTTLTGFESASLTFNNNGTLTFAAGVGITDGGNTLKKVTLAGNGAVNLTALAAGLTNSTAFNEIDASGVTGAFTNVAANIPVATVMTVTSGGGNDAIETGAGNTTVNSGAGNDTIVGGAGLDVINGGSGIDTIRGVGANDTLDGGSDADTFVFEANAAANGADTINGFSATDDALNLKAYDAAATAPTGTIADTSTGVIATADGDVYIVTDADGSIDTAGEVAGLFSAAGTPFAAGTANADVVLIIQDTQSGGSTTVWFVDNDGTAAVTAGESVQVANLSGFNGTIADANLTD